MTNRDLYRRSHGPKPHCAAQASALMKVFALAAVIHRSPPAFDPKVGQLQASPQPHRMSVPGQSRRINGRSATSVLTWRSQLIDATLYLKGKRWSVGWDGDFIEGLRRQKRRNYGTVGS